MRRSYIPRLVIGVVVLALALITIHDLRANVKDQLSTRAAVGSIQLYRKIISPQLRGVVHCRFEPTCSLYGLESVRKYGGVKGGWRAAKRIVRCNPWTDAGTVDPP